MTLQKILLSTDKRVTPRQLLQSLRDPFFLLFCSKTPAIKREGIEMSAQESRKKRQPAKETDRVAFRPMLLIAATVATVAFLTAVATLVLVLTMMLSRNSTTPSKDSSDVCGE